MVGPAPMVMVSALLLAASGAVAQTTPPCDLVNDTSVVGNDVTLLADLDCTGTTLQYAVVLVNGGVLDLNGFTLRANTAVRCDHEAKPCIVMSSVPGGVLQGSLPEDPSPAVGGDGIVGDAGVRVIGTTITSFAGFGIVAADQPGQKIRLIDSTVSANGEIGVIGTGVQLFGSVVSGNAGGGVSSGGDTTTRVEDSAITDNGVFGLAVAHKLKMGGSIVSGNGGDGVRLIRSSAEANPPRAVIRDSTIASNAADGLRATDRIDGRISLSTTTVSSNAANGIANLRIVSARDSTFNANGVSGIATSGADGCRTAISDTTITSNGRFGVILGAPTQPCSGGRFTAISSTLTGSGTDSGCTTTLTCGDVATATPPVLDASSSCDTSYVLASGVPGSNWSVCSLD